MGHPLRLDHLLLDRAAARPHQPLFVTSNHIESYSTIAEQAEAFAAALRRAGNRPGDRVALALDNLPQYLVAYFGTLRAGGVVVPLCADIRAEGLIGPLAHAEIKVAVLAARLLPQLVGAAQRVPSLRLVAAVGKRSVDQLGATELVDFASLVQAGKGDTGAAVGMPDDLACLMYTSGTTAAPKAVMLTHRNLLANSSSIVDYLGLHAEDRVALVLPLYYSYGISVLNTHVHVGATIVAAGSIAFPAAVLQQIAAQRCTGFPGVPSTFARLIRSNLLEQADLSTLRYLTQAGGPMSPELTQQLRQAIPHASLFVMYGQTEASPRLSYLPPADLQRKLGSAGRAIPGVHLEVIDEHGQPQPPGVVGELAAHGDNIMRGYWRDEAASARVLVDGKLRTGDLARMDDEGFIYLVGRRSDQIKSGAHRINPEEIEETIQRLANVLECAVVGHPHELLGETIVAFVVSEGSAQLDARQVMRHCYEQLPKFKQPARVVFIDALPRTTTGKLRRSELREALAAGRY